MQFKSVVGEWLVRFAYRVPAGIGLLAAASALTLVGCDSGSNSVPTSASTEQLEQVDKAQKEAAAAEMNRQPGS
ncbi:MAG: hypothetical protein U1A77_23505 [Pirellulales bacterium]